MPAPTLAVGGPTATGKTALAVELARRWGAELINADSRQTLRRLRAGTMAPIAADLRGMRCHLLDAADPGAPLSVTEWLAQAGSVLDHLAAENVPAILVGGTGQYLRALREGWEVGGRPPDPARRARLTATAASATGLATLVDELRARDPDAPGQLDLANPRRVIRALEVLEDGQPSLRSARRRGLGRPLALIVLDLDRDGHRAAVSARVGTMFGRPGILEEVRAELHRGTSPAALRRCGIGYAEALEVVAGTMDEVTAMAVTERRTLRYTKAQRTWFRAEPAALRIERTEGESAEELAGRVLAHDLAGAGPSLREPD